VLVVAPETVELVAVGTDVVEPWPDSGVVLVVAPASVELVSVGTEVVDPSPARVVVDPAVVVEVGAAVVDDASVDVEATVVEVEVGAAVVDEGGNVVLGADVVDDDAVVVVLQCDARSTDVLCVSEKPSGQMACTVKTMVPVVPPGTVDTADSLPLAATVGL
jgi:hypothetical protein